MLPHSLSQAQRQRLAVASILSMEPGIIVLDEPTTGQDMGHLNKFLARACNDVRRAGHSGAADCGEAGAVCGAGER